MNMTATNAPIQYSPVGVWIKKLLHTKFGAFIGFHLGITGFNRLETQIDRFQRLYNPGETLKNGEFVKSLTVNGKSGLAVYKRENTRISFNSRVDAGAALSASLISGTTLGGISSPAAAKYIALSTATLTPAKGDTTLASETDVSGLTRALGTAGSYSAPSTLDGAASYVLSKTFTAGGAATIVSAAIFDAASTGNLFVEANLASSAILATNDTLTINWTVNL